MFLEAKDESAVFARNVGTYCSQQNAETTAVQCEDRAGGTVLCKLDPVTWTRTHRAAACRLTATQGASYASAPVSRGMQILLWRSFLCRM